MRALGEAAARRLGDTAELEAEGWRQALQLLEELRERRLSASTRMLGGAQRKDEKERMLYGWLNSVIWKS